MTDPDGYVYPVPQPQDEIQQGQLIEGYQYIQPQAGGPSEGYQYASQEAVPEGQEYEQMPQPGHATGVQDEFHGAQVGLNQ